MKFSAPLFFSFSFVAVLLFFPIKDHSLIQSASVSFDYGVASGDPLSDQVIIWTKVTSADKKAKMVTYKIATDPDMKNVFQTGATIAIADNDHTLKVDVKGLKPANTYYYQFECEGIQSIIGRTKTLPSGSVDQVNLAIVSCSNFEWGYFNPLAALAKRDSIDAVLHLGDYIYEYQISGYGDTTIGRKHEPPHEIISLQDYRTRYAQYRSTPSFQKVHQMHPFISVWDDHEIANDSYVEGAQNHQAEEGDYQDRKAAARKAYFEWMPIRGEAETVYRKFQFGELVDLLMLDERLAGRTKPVESKEDSSYQDADRTMLGSEQKEWFFKELKNSKAQWKVIGNQVIFSDLRFGEIFPKRPLNLDAWDGYPYEKKSIIEFIKSNQVDNVIFTTGDTHCSWAFETPTSLEDYQKEGAAANVAVEFGTTSISSGNYDEYTTMDTVQYAQSIYTKNNPHLKYVNLHDHGYLLLRMRKEISIAEWYYVPGLRTPSDEEKLGKRIKVEAGKPQLIQEN